jgi:hypothetical protein
MYHAKHPECIKGKASKVNINSDYKKIGKMHTISEKSNIVS